ncbi:MAG: chemotaxis response regulator protein-glutamate methylesterase [Alphaproteobacteria bacterium]|nr:chemotaxis response regulator protein-glutamate methylesterase [Alphaproteobacteria bacterium]
MPSQPPSSPVKIMIVDDSAVIRGFLGKMISNVPDFEVVSTAANGQIAVNNLKKERLDIVLLDVEMPVMDGLTTIPLLLEVQPDIKIIMCSTLTTQNAETTLNALALGAVDCIAKPSTTQDIYAKDTFRDILTHTIKEIAGPRRGLNRPTAPPQMGGIAQRLSATPLSPSEKSTSKSQSFTSLNRTGKIIKLRTPNEGYSGKPDILAIGSSTGGPNALFALLPSLKDIQIPVIITQHMPPTFTRILAEHIQQQTGIPSVEGAEGMPLMPGRIHIAPGGYHMLFKKNGTATVISLDDGPMENFCRPAVDPMLRSATKIYGQKIMAVILTGMGQDGMMGSREVVKAGGRVIAQDESTSVVWGMPGAVAIDGTCTAVLPLKEIGPWLKKSSLRMV